jgi:hypothetical protein
VPGDDRRPLSLSEPGPTQDVEECDERWMARALVCARTAGAEGEVPVGAVVVRDGRELATHRSRRAIRRDTRRSVRSGSPDSRSGTTGFPAPCST